MSEENIATVRRLIEEVCNKGNLSLVNELIADEGVLHDPQIPPVHGTEGYKQFVSMYRSAFPDLHTSPLKTLSPKVTRLCAAGQPLALRGATCRTSLPRANNQR